MKAKNLLLISSILLATGTSAAESEISIGTTLSPEEVSKLNGPDIQLGEQSLKIIDQNNSANKLLRTSAGGQRTYVVNNQGVVGASENVVLISGISTAKVHASAKETLNAAISVKYYDHLNVSYLRFKSFDQAIFAREKLIKLFPNAEITIPIKFSEPKVR